MMDSDRVQVIMSASNEMTVKCSVRRGGEAVAHAHNLVVGNIPVSQVLGVERIT